MTEKKSSRSRLTRDEAVHVLNRVTRDDADHVLELMMNKPDVGGSAKLLRNYIVILTAERDKAKATVEVQGDTIKELQDEIKELRKHPDAAPSLRMLICEILIDHELDLHERRSERTPERWPDESDIFTDTCVRLCRTLIEYLVSEIT